MLPALKVLVGEITARICGMTVSFSMSDCIDPQCRLYVVRDAPGVDINTTACAIIVGCTRTLIKMMMMKVV